MSSLEPVLLTVREACLLLRVSRSTVERWIASGRLAAYTVGVRGVRVRRDDVEALVVPGRGGAAGRHDASPLSAPVAGSDLLVQLRELRERLGQSRGGAAVEEGGVLGG